MKTKKEIIQKRQDLAEKYIKQTTMTGSQKRFTKYAADPISLNTLRHQLRLINWILGSKQPSSNFYPQIKLKNQKGGARNGKRIK